MASYLALLFLTTVVSHAVAKDKAFVIVVDPAWDDTVGYVAHIPWLKDFKIIKVMINQGPIFSYQHGAPVDFYRKYTYGSDTPDAEAAAAEICPKLKSLDVSIEALIPTSDPSVALTDQLAACIGVRGNPAFGPLAAARRDKWVMGESIRKAGLRSVLEKRVSTWAEAKPFLETWEPPLSPTRPCIFKILTGVAGIGVYKVDNMETAEKTFAGIVKGQPAGFALMVQEYLEGREYAVDSVSRDGVHKVVAVWFEDFRPANGVFDQYFGFKMLDPEDAFTKTIIAYGQKVLDALGVHNGAANTEIKFLDAEQQPCLVEVNARWAGINWHDGLAVEQATVGQNQITAAFESYLDGDAFDRMPAVRPLLQHGAVIFTINFQDGILTGAPGMDAIKKYPSYYDSDLQVPLGKPLFKTLPSTIPAEIAFVHKDAAVVDADYYRTIDLEKANRFFTIEPQSTVLATQRLGRAGLANGVMSMLGLLMVGSAALVAVTVLKRRDAKHEASYDYLMVE